MSDPVQAWKNAIAAPIEISGWLERDAIAALNAIADAGDALCVEVERLREVAKGLEQALRVVTDGRDEAVRQLDEVRGELVDCRPIGLHDFLRVVRAHRRSPLVTLAPPHPEEGAL